MNAHADTPLIHRFVRAFAAAPCVLVTYTIFAVAVTFADFVVTPLASDALQARLVPYTGWVASRFYAFTIFFAFALIYQPKGRSADRFTITGMLVLQVAAGAWRFSRPTAETFDNPYLTISPWRPVWTILIPCVWMALLYLPPMNRFCRKSCEPQGAESGHRE